MWSGRFKENSSDILEKFNASINFDKNLFKEDINGSIAHANMLFESKIINKHEHENIINGLNDILKEINEDKFEFKIEDEDIHMAIEKRLSEKIGKDIGGKLHTSRSRNDQVAVDFTKFVMDKNIEISKNILNFIKTLTNIAKEHKDTLMPGFTHLQHAQPVSLAFHILAYVFMFKRDIQRFISSYERNNYSPLGSCALAGSTYTINRDMTAKELGFKAPTQNAMDSVSNRDFALEILFNISMLFMHMSRMCEELILWSSQEFQFINISDKFSTGSSIMPQKKNPDVAELIRGKTGRSYGNLISLLTTMKALPLAYNKDMQEDKECVLDSIEQAINSVNILNEMLKTSQFNKERLKNACKIGHLTATDLADYLVKSKNIPFREAHFIVGECVKLAENNSIDVSELTIEQLKQINPIFDTKALDAISLYSSKESRKSFGGTSNSSVEAQISEISNWIDTLNLQYLTK